MMRLLIVLSSLFLSACNTPTVGRELEAGLDRRVSPDGAVSERRIATIQHHGDPIQIDVPSRVRRSEEFTVRVRTYGGGCISKGEATARVERLSAVVTPYDWEVVQLPPNWACTMDLRFHEHAVTLRFEEAGTAVVEVRGRSKPSGEVLQIRRTVVVSAQ